MARRDRDQARRSVARLVSWVGEKSLGVEAAEAMARADLVEAVGERAARLEERAGLAAAEGAREARGTGGGGRNEGWAGGLRCRIRTR